MLQAFLKENENKLVNISIWKKSVKMGRFKNMYLHKCVTQEMQTLYIWKVQSQ